MGVAESQRVDVWVGRFESLATLEAYFEESYEEDDGPISAFARDLTQDFYDHDFIEYSRSDCDGLRALLSRHSFSSSYLEEVMGRVPPAVARGANTVLLAWTGANIHRPRNVEGAGYELTFIGSFACDDDAPNASA